MRRRPAEPISRRFHRRGRDKVKLRGWEIQLWNALFNRTPEVKLWAAVLCEALREVYASRRARAVRDTLLWIADTDETSLMSFTPLCEALGLDPSDIRRDLAQDVQAGRIVAKLEPAS